MIKVFIVEHKPSGKYLPPVKAYHSTTSRELSSTPRIFYRRQDAVCAARWWAAGEALTLYSDDWESGHREAIGISSEPVEGRKLEDLRICPAQLTFLMPEEAIT